MSDLEYRIRRRDFAPPPHRDLSPPAGTYVAPWFHNLPCEGGCKQCARCKQYGRVKAAEARARAAYTREAEAARAAYREYVKRGGYTPIEAIYPRCMSTPGTHPSPPRRTSCRGGHGPGAVVHDGNRIVEGLDDDDRHELLSTIEEAARTLAEAKYPCPTSRMTREEWEAEA